MWLEKLRRTSFLYPDSEKLELGFEVDDIASTAGRIAQKDANLVATAANQQPDTGQAAVFEDPDGNLIVIQAEKK